MDYKQSPRSSSRVHRLSSVLVYLGLIVFRTVLLAWALLKSRSGHQTTDSVVNRIVRSVVQIGLLGTLGALVGLITWFFLRSAPIYLIFEETVGPIYTNVRCYSFREPP
jgi:uncharacterized membrane protein